MNSSVRYQLMQGQTGDLPSDRIESRKKDGFRSIVHHYLHPCGSLQSPDVPAFTSDNTALHLVILDVEDSYGILDGRLRSNTLYCVYDYTLGLLAGIHTGFVHNIIDIGHGLGLGLLLHGLHKHLLGLRRRHARYILYFLNRLPVQFVILLCLAVDYLDLSLEILADTVILRLLALKLGILLLHLHLTLLELVLSLLNLGILLIDVALMLTLELKEFLLCLENLLFLDILSFLLRRLDYLGRLLLTGVINDQQRQDDSYCCHYCQ